MRSAPSAPASTIAPPPASASTASAAAKTVDAAKPGKADLAGEPKPVAKPHLATPTAAARFGRFDGVYSGPVCYGKTRELSEHCYRAEATIRGNTITGTWPMPNEFGVTMFLKCEVTPAGDVTVFMHSERADSTRLATINLSGTVHEGVLEADGKFLRGRSASINWHLAPSSAR